jgi:hypothetical protein
MSTADGPVHPKRQIFTRADWDRALQEGWLTPQHIVDRLYRIAIRDMGATGPAGYDEDGFFLSLTAEGRFVEGIGWFRVHTNDHDPPHVHVVPFGMDMNVSLKLSLEDGRELQERPDGVSSKQIKNMQKALAGIHDELGAWWKKNMGEPVVWSGP